MDDKTRGEKLRYSYRGLELLDENGAVIKIYFERMCHVDSTDNRVPTNVIITRDGEIEFKVRGKLVGVLDDKRPCETL